MTFLNLVNVSRLRSDWSSRFQSLKVDVIKDSVVIESLQKGIIKSEPFLKDNFTSSHKNVGNWVISFTFKNR
jgi:hypothetical protein